MHYLSSIDLILFSVNAAVVSIYPARAFRRRNVEPIEIKCFADVNETVGFQRILFSIHPLFRPHASITCTGVFSGLLCRHQGRFLEPIGISSTRFIAPLRRQARELLKWLPWKLQLPSPPMTLLLVESHVSSLGIWNAPWKPEF